VLAHYSNNYAATVYIGVKDQHGNQQTIVSNKIHPFFTIAKTGTPASSEGHSYKGHIRNGRWVDAANLTAGDQLLGSNNQWQQIVSVTIKPEPLKAFNLTVDQTHTYFIKGVEAGEGVWVHNNCWSSLPQAATATGKTTPDGRLLYIAILNLFTAYHL
jgi:filamentous hemagglutinin